MEAAADYSHEHSIENMKKLVLLLAEKSRLLIGETVLLCRLPDDVAKRAPEANLLINRTMKAYPNAAGIALTIANVDSRGNVILQDSIRKVQTLFRWDILLLAIYSKQE